MSRGHGENSAGRESRVIEAGDGHPTTVRRPGLWLVLLVLYGLCLNLPYLGSAPLMSHEVLVAQRTQGLMNEGGWVVPYRSGKADFKKPPLPFWISGALSVAVGDVNEWTLRLPSVAAALGTMMILVFYGRRLVGWRAALVTGWVFLTSAAALQYSRRAEVDMQLVFWTSLALVAYIRGIDEPNRRLQIGWFLAMWLAAGAGVLAKGPLPLGVLLVTMIVTAVLCPEGRRVGRMLPILGPAVLAAVLLAWAVPVMLTHPQALAIWYDQSLGRMAGELGREKPFYYYVVRAPTLWLPWILPLAVGMYLLARKQILVRSHIVFLLAWGLAGLALLSASTGKRVYYALPVTPPFLILAGIGLDYIVFVIPRKLSRFQWLMFWCHVAAVPAVLIAASVGATYLPQHTGSILALAAGFAAVLSLALWLYYSSRRLASLLVLAFGLAAVYIAGVAMVLTPMSLAVGREAAIGRTLAALPSTPACAFVTSDSQVADNNSAIIEFYARRRLPVIRGLDEMRRWLKDHPEGLVLVNKADLVAIRTIGSWTETLPPADSRWSESDFDLLCTPDTPAAPSRSRPGSNPRGSREMPHAE